MTQRQSKEAAKEALTMTVGKKLEQAALHLEGAALERKEEETTG